MLPGNKEPKDIETTIREFLEKEGGWARVEECSKAYSKGNLSKRTKFYRWRKKVDKNKVKRFQTLSLPGNMTYLGLMGADPNKVLENFMTDDAATKKMSGFFDRFKRGKKSGQLFTEGEAMAIAYFSQHEAAFMRNFWKMYVWVKRGAKPEEKPELETRDY